MPRPPDGSGSTAEPTRPEQPPRVLCVDDEPAVLDGLRRQLHRRFEVVGEVDGVRALEVMVRNGPFAVVMSDMRMPGLSGSAVLSQARTIDPYAVRILLTGQADLEDAVRSGKRGKSVPVSHEALPARCPVHAPWLTPLNSTDS